MGSLLPSGAKVSDLPERSSLWSHVSRRSWEQSRNAPARHCIPRPEAPPARNPARPLQERPAAPAPQSSGAETGRFLHPHSLPTVATTRSLGFRYASAPPGPLILTLTADPSYSIRPPRRRRGTSFTPQPPPSALGPAPRSEPAPHREPPPPPPPPERRRTELPSRSLLSPPRYGPPFSTT